MNKILGIDIGTHMGVAYMEQGKIMSHTLYTLKGKGIESPGMRFINARNAFIAEIETHEPDIIAYEAVKRWMSSDSAFVYNGILAQLLIVADERKINYIGYAPTEIKKTVVGKGKASKEEVIEWANKTYSYLKTITDDNEADAIAICFTANNKLKE